MSKMKYEKPVFYAELYEVTDSIAACAVKISDYTEKPLKIKKGEQTCIVNDGGHAAGKHTAKNGTIPDKAWPINVFNDGIGESPVGCAYDWTGSGFYNPSGTKIGSTWTEGLSGNAIADNDMHRPATSAGALYS